jgi:hypothetical protein
VHLLLKFSLDKTPHIFSILFVISVVGIVGFSLTAYAADYSIPDWVKNNAKWWSEDSISEADYVKSLEYLITNGIIEIPIPITEVTAASTILTEEERAQSFKVTISNIVAPKQVHFFEKFEMTSTSKSSADPLDKMYNFRDVNPTFFLESLPSVDKKQFYKFIDDWMNRGDLLNEFNIDVDVLDGTGDVIQTWSFTKCEITSYGTYLQDITNFYQFSGIKDSEIRDRTGFSCVGISLKSP